MNASFFRSPILVHCVTGVGRSATLAALDICLRKVDQTQEVNIRDTVERMRTQREMAVQKPVQFLFLVSQPFRRMSGLVKGTAYTPLLES